MSNLKTVMDIGAIQEIMKKKYPAKLLEHSLGVEYMARKLAAVYNLDEEKTAIAALLHDYGKTYPYMDLLRIAVKHDLADEIMLREPVLLHAPVGSWLLRREFGIRDEEILTAVRLHTTGADGMAPLAAVVYLADYIEPGRKTKGVSKLRELAFQDLQQTLLEAVDSTIRYILEKQGLLHPDSILFRNGLLSLLKNRNRELL